MNIREQSNEKLKHHPRTSFPTKKIDGKLNSSPPKVRFPIGINDHSHEKRSTPLEMYKKFSQSVSPNRQRSRSGSHYISQCNFHFFTNFEFSWNIHPKK